MVSSYLECQFDSLWEYLYPNLDLEVEQRIIPGRKFRFDYVHPQSKVAIEINGGIWRVGGHSSGKGISRDYEKLNLAQAHGYVVFQLSSQMISVDWLKVIAQAIEERSVSNA